MTLIQGLCSRVTTTTEKNHELMVSPQVSVSQSSDFFHYESVLIKYESATERHKRMTTCSCFNHIKCFFYTDLKTGWTEFNKKKILTF